MYFCTKINIKIRYKEARKELIMKEKKLKIFTLPIEEFEKKYPVSYSIVVPGIPEGHVAKVVSVRPC